MPGPACQLNETALLAIVTYTNASDPWTTPKAASMTANLLQARLPDDNLDKFIIESLLQQYFRSVFSKSSTRVTASGRPSFFLDGGDSERSVTQSPSWKDSENVFTVISRLYWTVNNSSVSLNVACWTESQG